MTQQAHRAKKTNFHIRTHIRLPSKISTEWASDGDSVMCDRNSEFFSSFMYRDQVTRNTYQISELKKCKKLKTEPCEPITREIDQTSMMDQDFKILQAIKQNRNKQLASTWKPKKPSKYAKENLKTELAAREQNAKAKRKIRSQIKSMNHEFFRQYLYNSQPYEGAIGEINNISQCNSLEAQKLTKIRNKMSIHLEKIKKSGKMVAGKLPSSQAPEPYQVPPSKLAKDQASNSIEQEFNSIWKRLSCEIGAKVKMQSQFNLYNKPNKRSQ